MLKFEPVLSIDNSVKQCLFVVDAELTGPGPTWGDIVDDSDTRTPGRVVHMHEKLSSPSRKRSVSTIIT